MQQNPMNILMQLMSMGQNPQQITNQILSQNPQLKVVFNQMQQSGMSTKDYVMQYAKQNNIDIRPMLDMFNQKGIKL